MHVHAPPPLAARSLAIAAVLVCGCGDAKPDARPGNDEPTAPAASEALPERSEARPDLAITVGRDHLIVDGRVVPVPDPWLVYGELKAVTAPEAGANVSREYRTRMDRAFEKGLARIAGRARCRLRIDAKRPMWLFEVEDGGRAAREAMEEIIDAFLHVPGGWGSQTAIGCFDGVGNRAAKGYRISLRTKADPRAGVCLLYGYNRCWVEVWGGTFGGHELLLVFYDTAPRHPGRPLTIDVFLEDLAGVAREE